MPSFLDTVELYDPAEIGEGPRVTGNRYSGTLDEYHSVNYNFVIRDVSAPRSIWVRLKTVSTSILQAEVLPFTEVSDQDASQNFSYGIYLGIIFISCLITFYIYLLNRDRIILIFSIKQLSQLIWSLFNIGYVRYFLDDLPFGILIPDIRHYPGALTVIFSMVFDYMFLREFGSKRWAHRLQFLLMGAEGLTIVFFLTGYIQLGLKLNIIAIWGFTFLSVAISIFLLPTQAQDEARTGNVPKGIVVFSYSLIAAILLLAILPYLGISRAVVFSLNAFIYHGLISAIALAALLGYRARSQLFRQFELSKALQISQRVAEEERSNRQEQSRFLSMLSHELKTPLAAIRLVLGLRNEPDKNDGMIERAVDDIDNIIKVCLEVEKVDDGVVELHKVRHQIDEAYVMELVAQPQRERLSIKLEARSDIQTDPRYLAIVLFNLLSNALKYSPDVSMIEIRSEFETHGGKKGLALGISNLPLRDDWPDAKRVFTKYYRSPQAHRKTGSGLGLYLVSQLCRMLGGFVRYEPQGEFVRFVVWFPV
jgi:signal transduction histidine kinase